MKNTLGPTFMNKVIFFLIENRQPAHNCSVNSVRLSLEGLGIPCLRCNYGLHGQPIRGDLGDDVGMGNQSRSGVCRMQRYAEFSNSPSVE